MPKRNILVILFSIVAPIGCVVADPFVFRYDLTNPTLGFSEAYLGSYQPFSYAAIVLSSLLMVIHLTYTVRSPILRTAIGGGFLASALYALLLGLVLLPYSLIGLVLVIGIFGFVPFATSWVYMSAAKEMLRTTPLIPRRSMVLAAGCLTFLTIAAGFHIVAQTSISRAIRRIQSSSADERVSGISVIRTWTAIFGHQSLISAHRNSTSDAQRQAIEYAYHSITDRDFQDDISVAHD